MRRKTAMYIAIVGGVLLLISGTNGVATWETIKNAVTAVIGEHQLISSIFFVLIFIAALGGIAVICGGILIGKGGVSVGKILVLLGCGTGLIGLIIKVVPPSIQQGGLAFGLESGVGTLGIILSVAAQTIAK